MNGHSLSRSYPPHTLVRLALHGDRAGGNTKYPGQPFPHGGGVRPNLRGLAHDHGIDIDHTETHAHDDVHRPVQEIKRVSSLPASLARREVLAHVTGPGRAEDGVDQRVRNRIAVGMPRQTCVPRYLNSPEHERNTLAKAVRVVTDPRPYPSQRRIARQTLCPPKPNEFVRAIDTGRSIGPSKA